MLMSPAQPALVTENWHDHCRQLEQMYCVQQPTTDATSPLAVNPGQAQLQLQDQDGTDSAVQQDLLQTAAYFAASTLERQYFLMTESARVQYLQLSSAIKAQYATAQAELPDANQQFIANAQLYDDQDRCVITARFCLILSPVPLLAELGYQQSLAKAA